MSIWKKAVSTLATAGLLASLLGTAVAGTAMAASTTVAGQFGYTANPSTQPADGLSYIDLAFNAVTPAHDVTVLQVAVTNGTFINGTGTFDKSVVGSFPRTSVYLTSASIDITSGTHLWLASSTAGTATVTVSYFDSSLATPATVYDSTQSFTFTGASVSTPSTALSTTCIWFAGACVGSPASAAKASGLTGYSMHTKVLDNNGNPILSGVTVEWTITGPAYFNNATFNYKDTASADATTGIAQSNLIWSTGAGGTATITTTVKYLGVSYTLPNKTLVFVGDPASITASNNYFSLPVSQVYGPVGDGFIEANVLDANGASITTGLNFQITNPTPAAFWTVTDWGWDSADKAWDLEVTCGPTAGQSSATIKAVLASDTSKTVSTSTPITVTCATPLDSNNLGKLTLDTSAATTVQPGGQLPITAMVTDVNGLPAPDTGTGVTGATPSVTAATNGFGTVVKSTAAVNSKGLSNGKAKFIYLAPSTPGTGVVTFFGGPNTVPTNVSVTVTVGAAASAATSIGSALGVTQVGPFTTATKIPALGKYATIKFGGFAAGAVVKIWSTTKTSAGTWPAAAVITSRIANASGDVYYYVKSAVAAWKSFSAGSGWVQIRWK